MSLVGVGWGPVVVSVFELWDVDGIGSNGPSLIGLPRDKLMKEDKTRFVVVECGGARSTRNGGGFEEGSMSISKLS